MRYLLTVRSAGKGNVVLASRSCALHNIRGRSGLGSSLHGGSSGLIGSGSTRGRLPLRSRRGSTRRLASRRRTRRLGTRTRWFNSSRARRLGRRGTWGFSTGGTRGLGAWAGRLRDRSSRSLLEGGSGRTEGLRRRGGTSGLGRSLWLFSLLLLPELREEKGKREQR